MKGLYAHPVLHAYDEEVARELPTLKKFIYHSIWLPDMQIISHQAVWCHNEQDFLALLAADNTGMYWYYIPVGRAPDA